MVRLRYALLAALGSGCGTPATERPVAPPPPPTNAEPPTSADDTDAAATGFLKGQLHLHSSASGDSETPATEVAAWYAAHGYDFIVFTDHNRLTELPAAEGLLTLPGVELTQNLPTCTPAPEADMQCLLHINALVVDPARADAAGSVAQPTSDDRVARYEHAMAVSEAMGGVAQLNHPNFHYAANAAQLTTLAKRGLLLFELSNEAWDSNNEGDATHPSTERMWDEALTAGAHLYATATDDAHHYDDAKSVAARGEPVFVGDKGFVMVRADKDAASIRDALRRGDFYASTGVLLDDVVFRDGVLEVRVAEATAGDVEIAFISDGGKVIRSVTGRSARWDTRGTTATYVRADVVSTTGARAWTQPVFLGH
jgi:hypothetical protein